MDMNAKSCYPLIMSGGLKMMCSKVEECDDENSWGKP